MTKGQLQIHSQNILPIIKKWLYSEKDIFVRELVSNACDAITKRSILEQHQDAPRIEITIDKEAKTLTFSDTGVGLEADETEKYLAQIAFSGAEEFIKAYQTNDAFIGHFGLGFYSAYMVADKVEVKSLSYKKDAQSCLWSCDGSSEYEVLPSNRSSVGTDIILHLNQDNQEFLEEKRLLEVVKRFCLFLPYPIFVNGTLVNAKEPLWLKSSSSCTTEDYVDFYKEINPFEEEPLFWIHLNVDYPFHVKGILYFPRIHKDFDFTKSHVKLYSNRVFVSDDCKDILPDYLQMLKGVIDSPDIPLNVSRSHLQVDKTVRALSGHIAKKVVDALGVLYKNENERFLKVWEDCEVVVKLGMLNDDKFRERAKDFLVWKTTKGNFVTIDSSKEVYYYVSEEQLGSHLVELYEQKGLELLVAKGPLDSALMALLERGNSVKFKRIDAEVLNELCDPSKENTLLDADGKTQGTKIADTIRATLDLPGVEVVAKSLESSDTAGFILLQEDERRFRDYMARISKEAPQNGLAKKTFVVNTNSPLISTICEIQSTEPELAKMMVQELYDLAALGQKELAPQEMKAFLSRSTKLLEKVAKLAKR